MIDEDDTAYETAALKEIFMKEIQETEMTPPSVEEVVRGAGSKRRRRFTLGVSATAFVLAVAGGGTVIASSVLDEDGESSAIIAVDAGRPVPGAEPGVVIIEGVTRGQVWRTRTEVHPDGKVCHLDLDPVTNAPGAGACAGPPMRDGVVVPDVLKVNWSGISTDNHDGTWSYEVMGTTAADVARVRLTWKGAREPVMLTAAPMTKDKNAFSAMITAEAGSPKFELVPLDANGLPFGSIDPPE
ncbi:hypothetical protein B4N89_00445 [Embleya scabrispora]|uniref:Uncharacterized protein n=1 Tax=Embleya scabrispora TaxID=159449 RepID=A0A1T3NRT8_9ACTN|nr:hypothetical protein [Embleya scabrispora]OPC79617.1 hypothetical protein B4N89_00445 [Embleya scabrispora]